MSDLRESSGILLIDKEAGITSHDVVDLFRRRTKIKRAGHTGTLDPAATGLLVLCIGKATRLQSILMGTEKTYEGVIQFGWSTDTYDGEGRPAGEAIEQSIEGVDLTEPMRTFVGEIEQMPPAYSAKKINGERAYEIARRGDEPDLKTKRVTVYEFSILEVSGSRLSFRLRCSSGTYVRSIAHDLGIKLGIPAHLAALRRTVIGASSVAEALPSAALRELEIEAILAAPHYQPLSAAALPLPAIVIDSTLEKRLINGQSILMKPDVVVEEGGLVTVSTLDGDVVAIATAIRVLREGGVVEFQPKTVLRER